MLRLLTVGATAALLTACATPAASPDSPAAMAMAEPTPTAAMPYVMKAAASDMFEIESSRVALQKSQNADVRRMAQMLIDHHTQTTAATVAAAKSAGMTPPPPKLEPMQADMIAQLKAAPAGDFDRLYNSQQVPAHEMALALHQTYASSGDTPSLQQSAASAVPIVQQHLAEARRMAGA